VAADRPACARLLAVALAGRSAVSYTTTGDTTYSPGSVIPKNAAKGGPEQPPILLPNQPR